MKKSDGTLVESSEPCTVKWAFQSKSETIGFAIQADDYNFKVVLLKRKGEASKSPGEPYVADVCGYYKNLDSALLAVMTFKLRREIEECELAANSEKILQAIEAAKKEVLQSLEHFKAEQALQRSEKSSSTVVQELLKDFEA